MTDTEVNARIEQLTDDDLQTMASERRRLYLLIETRNPMGLHYRMAKEILNLREVKRKTENAMMAAVNDSDHLRHLLRQLLRVIYGNETAMDEYGTDKAVELAIEMVRSKAS